VIADAGEIGSAAAKKLSATKGVPRANIQRGAGFGEAVRKKLGFCMAARFVSFLGWLGRARDRLLLQNLPHITDGCGRSIFFIDFCENFHRYKHII
jgi:hypothetical protein